MSWDAEPIWTPVQFWSQAVPPPPVRGVGTEQLDVQGDHARAAPGKRRQFAQTVVGKFVRQR
jgi:hypothetical protein